MEIKKPNRATVRQLRKDAEAAIEQLLTIVDSIDGDADYEEGGDLEPSLGALELHPHCIREASWLNAPHRDRDGSQHAWAAGSRDDREEEHDGAEPDVDDEPSGDEEEPSLGSLDRLINQNHAWRPTTGPHWVARLDTDLEID